MDDSILPVLRCRRIRNHQAEIAFFLEKEIFMKNLTCARRGAAAGPSGMTSGPSGMTSEHLKSILENARNCELLFQVAQLFARARIPHGDFWKHSEWDD